MLEGRYGETERSKIYFIWTFQSEMLLRIFLI